MSGTTHHQADEHKPHTGTAPDSGLSPQAKRLRAMRALLIEKGIVTPEEIQRETDALEARSPADGARVVARAWVDPAFRKCLLANPKEALAEMGYSVAVAEHDPQLVVVENTEKVHHMVVCTLCSCYPRALLGRPPDWYKSLAYRSRAVREPRLVLREFGLELDGRVAVRVLDSTADMRYLVVPRRPAHTERLSEQELARLVTRDSMIGVGEPRMPEAAPSR